MTEMDSMVVSMLGDDSDYVKMMDNVERKTVSTMRKVEQAIVKSMKAVGSKLQAIGRQLTIGITAPITALGALSVRAFAEEEQATRKLEAALNANGRQTAMLMADYKAFASQMQQTTIVADEMVISLLQTAESYGITGDSAKRAVKNAIAMQSAFGVSTDSALRMTAQLEKGNAQMLGRYIPTLKGMKDKAMQAAKAQDVLSKAFQVSIAEAQSGLGPYQQLMNQLSDLQEEFGKIILEGLKPFFDMAKKGITFLQGLDEGTKKWVVWLSLGAAAIGPLLLAMGGILTLMAPLVTVAGAVGATMLAWAPAVGIIAAIAAALLGVSYLLVGSEGLGYAWKWVKDMAMDFFMGTIGFIVNFQHNISALITWVSANWKNLFVDAGRVLMSFVTTSISNYQVMLQTFMRLGIAFIGWLVGLWERGFVTDMGNAIIRGIDNAIAAWFKFVDGLWQMFIAVIGQIELAIRRIAENIWSAITTGHFVDENAIGSAINALEDKAKAIRAGIVKDMVSGAVDPNFFNTAGSILKEQMGKLKGPLDDFKSSITEGPDLKFDFKMMGIGGKAEEAAGGFNALADSMKEVRKASDGIQATESGTTEALARLLSYRNLMPDKNKANDPAAIMANANGDNLNAQGTHDPAFSQTGYPMDPLNIAGRTDLADGKDVVDAQDQQVNLLGEVVEQLKIGNELTSSKEDIVLEPVGL